ncbi:hypothetical protein GQR58_029376 [Nymphon striatum]|nr:hypothetical protein GQR58_029376 [Nymphon striatum]
MKKVFFILLFTCVTLSLGSCEKDDAPNFHFVPLSIVKNLQIDPVKMDIKNATLNETQIVVSEEKTSTINEPKVSNEQVTTVTSNNIKNSEVASSKKQSENNIIKKISSSTTQVVSNATKKTAEEGITQTNQEVNKAVGLNLNGAEIVVANNQNETQDSSTKIANQNDIYK